VAHADAVGADERDVHPQGVQRPQGLFADGGLGQSAHAPAQQLQGDRRHGGQPRRDGYGIGHHHQFAVGGQHAGHPGGGGACVEQHAGTGQREEFGRGPGDGLLVVGSGDLPLVDAGFHHMQGADRDGAAVNAAYQPGPVQGGQVATHRLGGDVVGLGQFGDRCPPLRQHPGRDGLLTFFGVHDSPFVWDLSHGLCCFVLFYPRSC
jgi:hypothetical protein